MRKSELTEYLVFTAIIERGGFTSAGAQLGVTPSAVSQTLRKLEARLGVKLINRTTRSVRPTPAGLRLADMLRDGFDQVERAAAEATTSATQATGTVRLTVSAVVAELVIGPHLTAFQHRHPGIKLDVSVNERLIDIVQERFDAGIRRGDLLQTNMVHCGLSPGIRMLAVASPNYIARHPAICEPRDLKGHNCVRIRRLRDGAILPWRFAVGRSKFTLKVDGMTAVDTTTLALASALEGAGVAYLASDYLKPHLASGRLVSVLNGWASPRPGFHFYHRGRRQAPEAVRLLGRFLKSRLTAVPNSADHS